MTKKLQYTHNSTVTNLTKVCTTLELEQKIESNNNKLENFSKNDLVKCDLFKDFKKVLDIDTGRNLVYIYDIDEESDIYAIEPSYLEVLPKESREIVNLLYS